MQHPAFPEFAWASGEEASDPLVEFEGRTVRVDELARSAHLEHQDDDFAAVASLGVRVWRYGVPWRVTEPEPGIYDWRQWDRAFELCRRHGLQPVVDLCHFGLPDDLAGFGDPVWVDRYLRYVEAFLARYPEPRWFTPVNEPMVTANFSGWLGLWNDRLTSLEAFARILSHCVVAGLEAMVRIRDDRDGWYIGAEGLALSLRSGDRVSDVEQAALTDAVGRCSWDLHLGRSLPDLLEPAFGTVDAQLRERIDRLARVEQVLDGRIIAGHDFYPVSITTYGVDRGQLTMAEHVDVYEAWCRDWYDRYQVPFWVSETSNLGFPVDQQVEWLRTLADRLARLRADGLPVRGLCWYSRGDQFDWDTALTRPVGRVTEVGLFDVHRQPRPSAATFAALAAGGAPRPS